jgi:outer membrane murein-binding lipoprotein Lpp
MKTKTFLSASFAALALLMAGCASKGYQKASETSSTIEKTARQIHKGNGQIDGVLFALSSLVNNPEANIKPQFDKFDIALSKLEELSNNVNEQAAAMQAQGASYFRTWDEELAKIQNEDIRSRSADRKNVVAGRFDKVRISYVKTKAAFVPFMSDLKDIRTALATDLTVAGVASIKSTANTAQHNVTPLRESMTELETDFKALGVSISTGSNAK